MKTVILVIALLALPLVSTAAESASKTNARKSKALGAGDHAPSKAGGSTVVPPGKSANGEPTTTGGTGVPAPADMEKAASDELNSATASTGGTGTTLDTAGSGSKSNTTGKQ